MSDINASENHDLDEALFIRMVKKFPFLYNQHHKDFKNIPARKKAWAKIGETLGVPDADCCRLWRNFRDKYTRERRSYASAGKSPRWEFYEAMEFLNPYIKRRRSTKRLKQKRISFAVGAEFQDVEDPSTNTSNSVEVKFAPEEIFMMESHLEDDTQIEEIPYETLEDEESRQIPEKEIMKHQNSVKIGSHQTSEDAFGAYIASRLMDFPMNVRQMKKAKIFKALEDLGDF